MELHDLTIYSMHYLYNPDFKNSSYIGDIIPILVPK